MELQENDPVYYKVKLMELIIQAKHNGVEVTIEKPKIIFSNSIGEKAGVRVEGY